MLADIFTYCVAAISNYRKKPLALMIAAAPKAVIDEFRYAIDQAGIHATPATAASARQWRCL